MTSTTDDAAATLERTVEAEDLEYVFVEFPDLNGLSRGKQIDAEHFLSAWRKGFSMNLTVLEAGALDDWDPESLCGLSTDFADGKLQPIPETFTVSRAVVRRRGTGPLRLHLRG